MRHRSALELPEFGPARPRALTRLLTLVKSSAVGALLALVVVGGISAADRGGDVAPDASAEATEAAASTDGQIVQQAMTDQQCSLKGFDQATIPASALIRTADGTIKMVTFARGWDVYQGRKPGTLIAVCLREKPVH